MRTMLILVLLCSLAQFAIATRNIDPDQPKGCDTTYYCFVPMFCVDNTVPDITSGGVFRLTDVVAKPIFDDCPALIKFHRFATYWVHVWIESRTTETESIMFFHRDTFANGNEGEIRAAFSCAPNANGKLEGSYKPEKDVKELSKDTTDKIKCAFEVKLARNKEVFVGVKSDAVIQFQVKKKSASGFERTDPNTKTDMQFFHDGCDPTDLEYKTEIIDKKEVYQKVMYDLSKPREFYCKDSSPKKMYKMDYRAETDVEYKKNVDLKCNTLKGKFTIGGALGIALPIDIRCVAEAKYFCEYDPKIQIKDGRKPVKRVQPDPSTGVASELKCPPDNEPDYKHLYVKGIPFLNKKIECLTFGETQSWSIDGRTLTEDVHCEKEIQCNLLHKIVESNVRQGSIHNDLPKCDETGTLKVNGKEATDLKCDTDTGYFTYTTDGVPKPIEKDTIFECDYPKDDTEAKEKDAESMGKITKWSFIVGGIVSAVIAALIGGFLLFVVLRYKKERKEAEAINKAAFLKYSRGKDEKKKDLKKKKTLLKQSDEPEDSWNLNPFKMSLRYIGIHALKPDNTKEDKIINTVGPEDVKENCTATGKEKNARTVIWEQMDAWEGGKLEWGTDAYCKVAAIFDVRTEGDLNIKHARAAKEIEDNKKKRVNRLEMIK